MQKTRDLKFQLKEVFTDTQAESLKKKTRKKKSDAMTDKRLHVGLIFHRNGADWHVCDINDGYVFYRQFRHGKKLQHTRVYMVCVNQLALEILDVDNEGCFVVEVD